MRPSPQLNDIALWEIEFSQHLINKTNLSSGVFTGVCVWVCAKIKELNAPMWYEIRPV